MQTLSKKAVAVLTLIAEGHSYSQIVDGHHEISYLDVFAAAEEALKLGESPSAYHDRMAAIKRKYPKAYEKWTDQEDAALTSLQREGRSIAEIASALQRQPSAISSRIDKLELVDDSA